MAGSRAWRWGVAIAIVATLAACGREGERKSSGPVEVNGKSVDLRQLERESERAEKAAQKGTRALNPAGLKDLLPASVGGFARGSAATETGPEPNQTKASARYVKGTSAFLLEVTDLGAIGSIGASDDAQGAASTQRTASGYETITTAGGRMVTEAWDTASKSGRYSIVAADRFAISAEGSADTVDVLKAAVETVNAARLRALAG
uniref:hypothetical protein n=1 Tax=uncultured Caulobacter sp. TaxID=158749 RepID=UPI0025EBCEF6|nr:hypothetical protein [uncultured Caulobacter sp.]